MNAGAYGTEIADVLEEVLLLKKDGTLCRARAEELALAYRHSRMMETGEIVLETVFRLVPQARESIAEKMRALAMQRREKQPVTMPSAGSFFKRPPGHFAGALIEQAGLKGTRVGGAQVSTLHAGFLVNAGGATAQDFLGLAALVSEQVLKQSGVSWNRRCKSSDAIYPIDWAFRCRKDDLPALFGGFGMSLCRQPASGNDNALY